MCHRGDDLRESKVKLLNDPLSGFVIGAIYWDTKESEHEYLGLVSKCIELIGFDRGHG
jgi:hypothetical protein